MESWVQAVMEQAGRHCLKGVVLEAWWGKLQGVGALVHWMGF